MKTEFRYGVVGVGGIGSAAVYWLARRSTGDEVLGLERFALDHERGASRDHGRVIRYFYHRPDYVRMARASFEAWADVERDLDATLVHMTGGVTLHPQGTAIPAEDYTSALDACGVMYERLSGSEVRERWPQFRVPDDVVGIVQDDTGIVRADAANDTHVFGARQRGATVLAETPVRKIVPVGDGYELRTDRATFRCDRIVIAADAWTNEVLGPLGCRIPLTVTQEQVAYYRANEAFSIGAFPVWAWFDSATFYGLPAFADVPAKAAMDSGGPVVDPDERTFERDEPYHERVEGFLAEHLPELLGELLWTKTCLYAMTPDRDFVIDRLPEHPGIVVCQGAAHAFKFASLIGRVAADLSMGREPEVDITPFAFDRSALSSLDPAFDVLLRARD
jgi:sarcosine oxidase